jgi:phosphosulfolactate synthase
VPPPRFLDLPARASKPRIAGLTHVLDKGLPLSELESLLNVAGTYIDLWKFGWGTAYLDPALPDKIARLAQHRVRACVGGTLLEVAWAQGRVDALFSWAAGLGLPCVEVSNGALEMPLGEKRRLIAEAAKRFVVLSEVGSKDPLSGVSPARWAKEMAGDLEAGASWVLGEGRESGTVGLYTPEGSVREDLVSAVTSAVGAHRVIFEAPRKDQQTWFIRQLGPDVNLGNLAPAEVLGVEALRLGLRADTIGLSCPSAPVAGTNARSGPQRTEEAS